jgi:hypothetical protein
MTKKKAADLGRPKTSPDKKYTRRHVVNISPEMERAAEAFCEEVGIAKMTDGLRALITTALREKGKL